MKRVRPLLLVLALVAVLAAASGASARPSDTSSLNSAVFARINQLRAAHGLHALRLSSQLNAAALQHSQEMVTDGYFSHDSSDGTSAIERIRRYYPSAGYRSWGTGENILYGSPSTTAAAALTAWIHSPGHLRNMLDPRWREIGVSAVHSDSAPGIFKNQPVTVITTDFGFRRR